MIERSCKVREGFIKKALLWTMTSVCFVSIFLLSSQPADSSNSLSRSLVEKSSQAAGQLAPSASKTPLAKRVFTNKFFRDAAHVVLFSLLALFIILSLRAQKIRLPFVISGAVCVLYAIVDETYQSRFVDGRSFEFVDLIKDWAGSLTVIAIFSVTVYMLKYRKEKREIKKEVENV